MPQQDQEHAKATSEAAARHATALRAALEAVVEIPPPLRALQAEAAHAADNVANAAGVLKRDELQAGASHRDRVRACLLTLEATAPETALAAVQAEAVAVVRGELPRLAALESLVEAEAAGDPPRVRQAIQAVRDAAALADADRVRLGAALHALAGAQPTLFKSLQLPERVLAALDVDRGRRTEA